MIDRSLNEITQLNDKNTQLEKNINLILEHRSWRIMVLQQKLGHVINKTKYILMIKKIVKYTLTKIVKFVNCRPTYKRLILRFLHVTKLYKFSRKFYCRYISANATINETINSAKEVLLISYHDSFQQPPAVENIYLKLNK